MKIDRQSVYDKFDGKCAYCGIPIKISSFHVDHLEPQRLEHLLYDVDNNRFTNLMPSCYKCNRHKGGMRLETWRKEIERHSDMLLNNAQFERALRYGQVAITKKKVLFYFEKINRKTLDAVEPPSVCPHAKLKHAVYECDIRNNIAIDMLDCNGKGEYSVGGNNGFGYSYQCNSMEKPAKS